MDKKQLQQRVTEQRRRVRRRLTIRGVLSLLVVLTFIRCAFMQRYENMFVCVLSLVLLILLTTTFLSGPATLLQGLCGLGTMTFRAHAIPIIWVLIIFGYYMLATILPVDKLIGRFYPIFGGVLLFMGLGIMVVMLGWHGGEMPELTDGLHNRQTNGLPLFPMMFVRSHLRIPRYTVASDGALRNKRASRTLDFLRRDGGGRYLGVDLGSRRGDILRRPRTRRVRNRRLAGVCGTAPG